MEVPVKLTGEFPNITVLLSQSHGDTYKPFKCPLCGNFVFEYNNDYIRTILPSGQPQTDKPGKVIVCTGVMNLHGTSQLYDLMYSLMDSVFNQDDITAVRSNATRIAKSYDDKYTTRCKARFHVT